MRRETKEKIKGKLLRVKNAIVEVAPAIAIGTGIGMLVGGYYGALKNGTEIGKLNKRTSALETNVKELHEWADKEVVPKHNAFADWTHKEIERLDRENRALMERALRETEGKA